LGGKGFAFYINDPMSPDEADDFLRKLTAIKTGAGISV